MTMFNYKKIDNFLEKDFCDFIIDYFIIKTNFSIESSSDKNDLLKYFHYSDFLVETILQNSMIFVREIVQEDLYPSYTYSGIYTEGDKLDPHKNKKSEKIEGILFFGSESGKQKIYLSNKDDCSDSNCFELNAGDLLLFNGHKYWHWSDNLDIKWSIFSFLYYTDDANSIYDEREYLGFPQK